MPPLTGHLCPQDVPLRAQFPAQRRARHVPRHRREDLGGDVRQGRAVLLQNHHELRFRSINEFGTYIRWFLLFGAVSLGISSSLAFTVDPPTPAADDGVVAFLEKEGGGGCVANVEVGRIHEMIIRDSRLCVLWF